MTAQAGTGKCKDLVPDFEFVYVFADRLNFPGEL